MKQKTSVMNTLAILTVFLIAGSAGNVGALVQPMIEAFPNVAPATVRMVTTIPSLTGMIVTFLVGLIAGKKVGFRTICIFGSCCMVVGGLVPFFLTGSIYLILVCRLIFGIGTGCFGIRNALVIRSYSEDQRANMLGKGMFFMNLASILMSTLSGILGGIAWNYGFLIYLTSIVTLICTTLFLREPEAVAVPKTDGGNTAEKKSYPACVFILGLFLGLVSMTGYCIIVGISTFLKEQGLGEASMAGTVISVFSIGGVLGGYFFGSIFKKLKKFNLPAFALISGLGFLLIRLAGNMAMIYIGSFLNGVAFSCFMSTVMAYVGMMVEPKIATSATTIIMTINQVGILVASYYIAAAGKLMNGQSEVAASFVVNIIIMAAVAILSVVLKLYPKAYDKK